LCDYSVWKTASSVWRLARAAAASGAVSSPAPAAGSPSGQANVNMLEAEGGWADLLHETALEASSSQASAKPASVPESGVTLPQQTRYAVSPQKGSKAVTMAHFFARDLARAPTANFSVRYSKSLTVGVEKKNIIPLCHVAHELTSRTYGEKKWWVVIVKDQ